jgi:hypothetical protein
MSALPASPAPRRRGLPLVAKIAIAVAVLAMVVPLLLVITGLGIFGLEVERASAPGRAFYKQNQMRRAAAIETARRDDPLVGEILAFEDGKTTGPALHAAIASADPLLLSKPYVQDGAVSTPLAMLLRDTGLDRTYDRAKAPAQTLEAAKLLMSRGGRLSPEEENTVSLAWMADVVDNDRPVPDLAARNENELVFRIMNDYLPSPEANIREIARTHPEQLSKPTTTYGTPVRAAFIREHLWLVEHLAAAGAQLSDAERKQPGLAERYQQYLDATHKKN